MESDYVVVILVTFFGFVALAALLLVPVWRFLTREEKVAEEWTEDVRPEEHTNGEEGRR